MKLGSNGGVSYTAASHDSEYPCTNLEVAVHRSHSSAAVQPEPQLFAASTPLSCEVYIVLWHTHAIEQSRLRCVTLSGSKRGCWGAPIDDGSRVSHERRGGVLYGPAGVS